MVNIGIGILACVVVAIMLVGAFVEENRNRPD